MWYFLVPFLTIAVAGTLIVLSLPAIFTVEAKISWNRSDIPTDLVKSTVTAMAEERLQVIEQRVMTRDNLLSLVEKFGLFAHRNDLSRSDIVELMRARVAIEPLSLNFATNTQRANSLAIAFATKFDYEVPDTGVKVVNELVTFILNEDARSRNSRATETSRFLDREIQRLSVELKTVESQIADFKQQNRDALPERQDLNVSLLSKAEQEISDLQRRLVDNDEQKRLLEFESSLKSSVGGSGSSVSLISIEDQLKKAQTEYATKKAIYAENHPEMRTLKQAIASLEQQLAESQTGSVTDVNSGSTIQSLEARVFAEKIAALDRGKSALNEQFGAARSAADNLRAVLAKSSEIGTALAEMDRKRNGLQKALDEISEKYAQARLGQQLEADQQAERFEVLEQPTLPQSPSKPKRPALLAIVFALATLAGAGISGGAELLDNTIRRSRDLTSKLNRRPIVIVPHISTRLEDSQKKKQFIKKWLAGLVIFALILAAIHVFYRPLDVLFYRLMAETPWF